jgi:hypothetical protein
MRIWCVCNKHLLMRTYWARQFFVHVNPRVKTTEPQEDTFL